MWSLCVGLFIYKGFSFKDIPHIFANVVETLGKVLILLGVSGAFTYLLTYLRIPTMICLLYTSAPAARFGRRKKCCESFGCG